MKRIIEKSLVAAVVAALVLPLAAFAQSVPQPGKLALQAAKDYRLQARYPAHSKALPEGSVDPVAVERVPSEITVGRAGEPQLTVWGAEVVYEYPAPVAFYARVAEGKAVAITGEVVSQSGATVGQLSFFDDGARLDKAAQDGVFTARVAMQKAQRPELAENYLVKIQATFEEGTTQYATAGFLYTNPHAKLLGRYRDRVVGGNLQISARVAVEQAGRFHLSGVLHTLDGEPIGTAQTAVVLEPGKHWIDLEFYGLMFHDRGVRGPYKLGSVVLTTTGAMPNALGRLVSDAHVTRGIPLKSLTHRPFGDDDLLEQARRLEASVTPAGTLEK